MNHKILLSLLALAALPAASAPPGEPPPKPAQVDKPAPKAEPEPKAAPAPAVEKKEKPAAGERMDVHSDAGTPAPKALKKK